jgi:hypothetical protein
VPPADPEALAAALARLAADPRLRERLGAAGRRRAETEFALAEFHRAHRAVYRTALEQAGRAGISVTVARPTPIKRPGATLAP